MALNTLSFRRMLLPLATALLCLFGTAIMYGIARETYQQHERARFDALADKIVRRLEERVNLQLYGLRAARGIFLANSHVKGEEFDRYMESRDLAREFPGSLGFGYIQRVPRKQLELFLTEARADEGTPELTIDTHGNHPDLYIMRFFEPLPDSIIALGHDIAADPSWRAAADQAMLSGEPTVTTRIKLTHDGLEQFGFLYLMPVYDPRLPSSTPTQRREALRGWAYTPLIMGTLMEGVTEAADKQIDFEVYDGLDSVADTELFDADHHLKHAANVTDDLYKGRMFHKTSHVEVGGRTWSIWFSTLPEFNAMRNNSLLMATALGGIFLTLLLTGIVAAQGRAELRATRLAKEMTESLRDSEVKANKLAAIASRTTNSVMLMDAVGHIEWVNSAFTQTTGYELSESLGKTPTELLTGAATDQSTVDRMRNAIQEGRALSTEVLMYTKAGREFWNNLELQSLLTPDGKVSQMMAIGTNVTDQRQAVKALKESEARFRAAIEGGFDLFYLLRAVREDGVTIVDFEFVDLNQRAAEGLGMLREQILGRRLRTLLTHEGISALFAKYVRVLETGKTLDEECFAGGIDPQARWTHQQAVRVGDGLAITCRDITDRKTMEHQLRDAAQIDRLTELPNRGTFFERLEQALQRAQEQPHYTFGVLFLDFDRFKQVNDTLGHEIGDALLVAIAGRLRTVLRFSDRSGADDASSMAARLGGDEFVVLLRNLNGVQDAQPIATRLLEALNKPYSLKGHVVNSTASIGIVTSRAGCQSAEELVRRADAAMYRAKTSGKNCYAVYDSAKDNHAMPA